MTKTDQELAQEKVDASDWSYTVQKLATLEDEDLLLRFGVNAGLLILARAAHEDREKSKILVPRFEKLHKLMCEEIKRRGLKHKDMMI